MASASNEAEDELNSRQNETISSDGEKRPEDSGVAPSATRSVYLVTYSQASLESSLFEMISQRRSLTRSLEVQPNAWRYVTKSDEAYEESNGHPDLVNTDVPKTSKASIGKRNLKGKAVIKTQTKTKKKPKRVGKARKKRLTPLDVSNLILSKNIKTETELHTLAQEQREQGKIDLVEFILNRSPKTLADILSTTWQMKGAREKIARSKKSRMDLLQEA
ncbi:Hypothetical predicted protein [Paramuricea clavata]|uniref:Uncharacterized protein n=1 Tax=Paramuricea clavata TaxID=317549 RepID=A0A7D9IWT4_PARCT|nr:Hypothetical predicted protein [Paramuricea clavata]